MFFIWIDVEVLHVSGRQICYGLIGKIHTYLRARGGKHCIKKFFQELIRDHHRKHKVVELIILMYIGKEARHYYAESIVMYGPCGMFARGTAAEILSGDKNRTGISRVIEHKTVNLVSFLVESPVAEQIVTEPLS